ncbi:MAG: flagellar M-ring protein FliF [Phycisphaerae bacterium]|nr:flagellar M-ring protein FliF [Phycisphaerae bacterium]
MGNIVGNLAQVWRQSSAGHKLMLIGIVAGFLIVGALLLRWASQPDFALLYSDLNSDDAAKIEEKLRDEDIPCRIKDGGTTILVPSDKVHTLRLAMVRDGLPTGGNQGYGILDNGELGQSPFKERVNYIRAIEGELVKTIKLIEGVAGARVHVVNEQHSVFARGQKESSATVVIKTRGGAPLSAENVAAITSLVAGAVKDVTPEKVVVVANGKLLTSRGNDELMGMGSTLFEAKMKIESYYAQKAETMLAHVLGAGRATVKVDATLATASIRRTRTTFDKKNQTETRVRTVKTTKSSAAKAKRGNSSPGGVNEDEKSDEIEYMTPSTVETTAQTPGSIESLAAAVFVDLSALTGAAEGGEKDKSVTLTTDRIREAVGSALGLDKSKEDWKNSITVVDVPFQTASLDGAPAEEAPNMMSTVLQYTKDFSLGIAVLGMLLVFKMLKGKKSASSGVTEVSGATSVEGAAPAGGGGGGGGGRNNAKQLSGPDRQLRSKIVNALTSNPDQVKQLFLSWVESDGGK